MDIVVLLASNCPSVTELVEAVARGVPGLRVEACPLPAARDRARRPDVGMVLADLGSDGEAGVAGLLGSVAESKRACPTVVLCGGADGHRAAALLGAGAADYACIPSESARLRFLLSALTSRLRPADEGAPPGGRGPGDEAGEEDGLGPVMAQLRRVAPQETTVLLTGETGTGKTRLARLLHELSPRRGKPFLVVDCGAVSPELVESELFGHVKGAFTGADRDRAGKLSAAGDGTLLLDEVNSLPLPLQAKLLRAVDERVFTPVGSETPRPVRARLVAASNAPLEREVAAGRFRSDLFYRLNVVGFRLPPLREGRGRVVPLARSFLAEFVRRNGRADLQGFSPAAELLLAAYGWPGNVRELRNVVERAVALGRGPLIEPGDLPGQVRGAAAGEAGGRMLRGALPEQWGERPQSGQELGTGRMGLYKSVV